MCQVQLISSAKSPGKISIFICPFLYLTIPTFSLKMATANDQPWFQTLPVGLPNDSKITMEECSKIIFHYRTLLYKFGLFMSFPLNTYRNELINKDFDNNNYNVEADYQERLETMRLTDSIAVNEVISRMWPSLVTDFFNTLTNDQEVFGGIKLMESCQSGEKEAFIVEFWSPWLMENCMSYTILEDNKNEFLEQFPDRALLTVPEVEFVKRVGKNCSKWFGTGGIMRFNSKYDFK